MKDYVMAPHTYIAVTCLDLHAGCYQIPTSLMWCDQRTWNWLVGHAPGRTRPVFMTTTFPSGSVSGHKKPAEKVVVLRHSSWSYLRVAHILIINCFWSFKNGVDQSNTCLDHSLCKLAKPPSVVMWLDKKILRSGITGWWISSHDQCPMIVIVRS